MDRLEYIYGANLSQTLSEKLNKSNLLPEVSPEMLTNWYLKDAFTASGSPVNYDEETLYPAYAPRYLGQFIPSSLLSVDPGYRDTASKAAVEWLEKMLYLSDVQLQHFDGEKFTMEIDGQEYNFCFPAMVISYSKASGMTGVGPSYTRHLAAIIPFPDTRENDDDWDGATIPAYAESQARFTLWCWRQSEEAFSRRTEAPVDCFIVRITGNTPSDVSVRTVHADPPKEDALVARICKAYSKAKANGTDPVFAPKIRQQAPWYERKQTEIEEANHIEDPAFYMLVRRYMELVTLRKTKEAQAKEIKQQMESICVSLAAETSVNATEGSVTDTAENMIYTVKHTRRYTRAATISASLIRQFFPEHLDCIVVNEIPRGRITIEADD